MLIFTPPLALLPLMFTVASYPENFALFIYSHSSLNISLMPWPDLADTWKCFRLLFEVNF